MPQVFPALRPPGSAKRTYPPNVFGPKASAESEASEAPIPQRSQALVFVENDPTPSSPSTFSTPSSPEASAAATLPLQLSQKSKTLYYVAELASSNPPPTSSNNQHFYPSVRAISEAAISLFTPPPIPYRVLGEIADLLAEVKEVKGSVKKKVVSKVLESRSEPLPLPPPALALIDTGLLLSVPALAASSAPLQSQDILCASWQPSKPPSLTSLLLLHYRNKHSNSIIVTQDHLNKCPANQDPRFNINGGNYQYFLAADDLRIVKLCLETFNVKVPGSWRYPMNSKLLREPDPAPGCCAVFMDVLRACGLVCYVACPPVPSVITRKLAFHPPQKGVTYRIALKEDPQKELKSISQCKNDQYQLIVRNFHNGGDYMHPEKDVEVFSVRTANRNELVCIKCSPDQYSSNPAVADQVILFCQPNSSDLGGFLQPNSMNFVTYANVFETDFYAFDYSGYGFSSGTQSEKNMYADVRAVYQRIRETRPDKKIVIMGYSIGTTAAVDLAATNPEGLSGVVLVAPFTSGLRLFSKNPDKPNTCWIDSFTSFDKIGNIDTRVLICHGDLDEVIPLSHGMALYEKLKNPVPPSVIHGANHQTILSGRYLQVFTRIASFLRNETLVSCRSTEAESQSSPSKTLKTNKTKSGQSLEQNSNNSMNN